MQIYLVFIIIACFDDMSAPAPEWEPPKEKFHLCEHRGQKVEGIWRVQCMSLTIRWLLNITLSK